MQFAIFTVPILSAELCDSLNAFLSGHKILAVDKQLVSNSTGTYWTFCVSYVVQSNISTDKVTDKKSKIDYREILSETEFVKFTRLRAIRKQLAEEDAVPAYAVFTDEEMSKIVKLSNPTVSQLTQIEGIGEKRAKKYYDNIKVLWEKEN